MWEKMSGPNRGDRGNNQADARVVKEGLQEEVTLSTWLYKFLMPTPPSQTVCGAHRRGSCFPKRVKWTVPQGERRDSLRVCLPGLGTGINRTHKERDWLHPLFLVH